MSAVFLYEYLALLKASATWQSNKNYETNTHTKYNCLENAMDRLLDFFVFDIQNTNTVSFSLSVVQMDINRSEFNLLM